MRRDAQTRVYNRTPIATWMSGYTQPVMAPGPVQYKRKYTLWVLVVLILFCWPAAIIYYFTRDKVPVQEFQTYSMPVGGAYAPAGSMQPGMSPPPMQPSMGVPSSPPQPIPSGGVAPNCPRCGRPTTWVGQYNRWYCVTDQQYV